jgi:hypothetical protein
LRLGCLFIAVLLIWKDLLLRELDLLGRLAELIRGIERLLLLFWLILINYIVCLALFWLTTIRLIPSAPIISMIWSVPVITIICWGKSLKIKFCWLELILIIKWKCLFKLRLCLLRRSLLWRSLLRLVFLKLLLFLVFFFKELDGLFARFVIFVEADFFTF